MLRVMLRSIAAHKLRLILSGLAVVLGVAFVSGTFVFTDTLSRTFTDLFGQTTSDVEITPVAAFEAPEATDTGGASIDASLVDVVAKAPGAEKAAGSVLVDGVVVIGADGQRVGVAGAPAYGVSWSDDTDLSPFRLVPGQGDGPRGPGQIAVDSQTVEKAGLQVGDRVSLVTPRGTEEATLTGVFRFGTSGNLAGASLTAFDEATAQKLLLKPGAFTAISVKAADGVSQEELKAQVVALLPAADRESLQVQTGQEAADDAADQIAEALGFVNTFLLVFAGIALLVGSFIILNTFSMLVAQRARELALLRALGASRRQVTAGLLGEAAVVGILGALVGILLGLVLAQGLQALISAIGGDVPTGGLILRPRTVVTAVAVGTVITLIAAYAPARRAGRVPPVAAMRDEVVIPQRSLRLRRAVGAVVLLVSVGLLLVGIQRASDGGATWVGAGAGLLFVAAVVLGPLLADPFLAVAGAPLRRVGVAGRLGAENARRNRRRTASTASALMIGLALVGTIAILGASTTASTNATVDRVVGADLIVADPTFRPFPADVAEALRDTEGVAAVSPVQQVNALVEGEPTIFASVDPATVSDVITVTTTTGSVADAADGWLLDDVSTEERGFTVGQRLTATLQNGATFTLPLLGIYERSGFFSGFVTARQNVVDAGAAPLDSVVYATVDEGSDVRTVATAAEEALAAFPTVEVRDQEQFKDEITGQINQILTVIYALLGLAVVISILGIVNTLALSVVERTREIGLLRAVGMTRRQLRSTVRWESMLIAIFGAVLGVVIGVVAGTGLQRVLSDTGINILSIPWALLAAFLVVAALVGVLAAVWPARRAARMDVLAAITSE